MHFMSLGLTSQQLHHCERKAHAGTGPARRHDLAIDDNAVLAVLPARSNDLILDAWMAGDVGLFAALQALGLAGATNTCNERCCRRADDAHILARIAISADQCLY